MLTQQLKNNLMKTEIPWTSLIICSINDNLPDTLSTPPPEVKEQYYI